MKCAEQKVYEGKYVYIEEWPSTFTWQYKVLKEI